MGWTERRQQPNPNTIYVLQGGLKLKLETHGCLHVGKPYAATLKVRQDVLLDAVPREYNPNQIRVYLNSLRETPHPL